MHAVQDSELSHSHTCLTQVSSVSACHTAKCSGTLFFVLKTREIPFIQLVNGQLGQSTDRLFFFVWRDSNPLVQGRSLLRGNDTTGLLQKRNGSQHPPSHCKGQRVLLYSKGKKQGLENLPSEECSKQLIPHGERCKAPALSEEPELQLSVPVSLAALPFLAAILRLFAQGWASHEGGRH